eukprot:CAMPEP_0113465866 /NCGR_PEP_ID=MMETSP0014_2-20120614/13970_1 /TAXON_ID=2857 /ORGANISM="Nitzschia sp." /LENGTH=558 /DNA_ID=CAMNT_0000358057 /DNA_START=108 /DNA_END=1784 /DNA_ORIENTATION=+ /assembly_acc=CAM_ASM_000159
MMKFTAATAFLAASSSILWLVGSGATTPAFVSAEVSSSTIQEQQQQYPILRLRSLQTDLPPLQDTEEDEEDETIPVFEVDTSPPTAGRGIGSSSSDDDDSKRSYQDPGDIVRVCDGGIMSSDMYRTKCEADSKQGRMKMEDSTSYKVKTGSDGIIIEMKYESEIEMDSDDSESEDSASSDSEDGGGGGDEGRKLRHEHRRRRRVQEEAEIENKFEAKFHKACLYRKAGGGSQEQQQQEQQQQETAITTAQQRQNNGVGDVDATIELTNNVTAAGVDTNGTTNEETSPPQVEETATIEDGDSSAEAFEWGVDNCDVKINLMDWSSMKDLMSGVNNNNADDDGMSAQFSSVGNGIAEFLFTVVQRSTTDLSANSIKFDLNVDGVAAQLSGTDYHLAMFADIKTKQKIEIEGASSDDTDDERSEGPSSGFISETGTKSSTSSEIKDITVPFNSVLSSTFTPLGHFSWKDEAEATSTKVEPGTGRRLQVTDKIKVIATVPADQVNQQEQTVAFSFTGPGSMGADYIHWDPEAGVGYQSSSAKIATCFAGAIIVATTIGSIMF